jgi:hypothetical protein
LCCVHIPPISRNDLDAADEEQATDDMTGNTKISFKTTTITIPEWTGLTINPVLKTFLNYL